MFKVYTVYSNNEKFYTDNFFVKFGNAIVWVKSDIEINEKPYFSEKKMKEILGNSNEAENFAKLKKGDVMNVQYGSCTNNYLVVKMTDEEVKIIKEIKQSKKMFEKVQNQHAKQLNNVKSKVDNQTDKVDIAIKSMNEMTQ